MSVSYGLKSSVLVYLVKSYDLSSCWYANNSLGTFTFPSVIVMSVSGEKQLSCVCRLGLFTTGDVVDIGLFIVEVIGVFHVADVFTKLAWLIDGENELDHHLLPQPHQPIKLLEDEILTAKFTLTGKLDNDQIVCVTDNDWFQFANVGITIDRVQFALTNQV